MPRMNPKSPTRLTRKAFKSGERRRRPRVPKADEQVGHHADALPAEEQLHEVVRHHQHQHREREQRDVAEEALIAVVIVHVADGVDVHHQRHEGHHRHHQGGQTIDQEADLDLQPVADQPRVNRAVEGTHALRTGSCTARTATARRTVATPAMATLCAPARPMTRPNKPAAIAAASGASAIVR